MLQAAERLGSVQQEVAILRHAAAMPEEERQRQREARQAAGPPPDLLRQLHAAAGSLSSAAVQRQRLTDGVFRPSHVLPTMSVEQFGELEYARCALLCVLMAAGRGGQLGPAACAGAGAVCNAPCVDNEETICIVGVGCTILCPALLRLQDG